MSPTTNALCLFLGTTLCLLGASDARANNIAVSAGTLTANSGSHVNVRFSISWENSWRNSSTNAWDAAWVFVKYKDLTTGLWQHARLGDQADHLSGTGTPATITNGLLSPSGPFDAATNWGVGVFIHRSADGSGTFSSTDVELRWNYAQNGISYTDIDEVKVFAIEMVHIAEGPFFVGSGGTENGRFKDGTTNDPFLITSEDALSVANVPGSLWAEPGSSMQTQTLPASTPKGFKAFYMMKYEVTQQAYVDFLNTLTRTQQDTRVASVLAPYVTATLDRYVMLGTSFSLFNNGIRCDQQLTADVPITFYCDLNGNDIGGEANDGQWLACNYLNFSDAAAYLDWSGLRLMSELEYEKAARGPLLPVANEFAWGNTTFTPGANSAFPNSGAIDESAIPVGANVSLGGTPGVRRVGVFATGSSGRVEAGASYYGVMELSGNVYEPTARVGGSVAYPGNLGDGSLNAAGDSNTPGVILGVGYFASHRGGSIGFNADLSRISGRNVLQGVARDRYYGARGVR
ncbi:MAG TPA: SUMF1/EgtB/PvdO family nonheme iron enzyme [Flavobacteriales bacterium]|nr:SUMF1/EgtB/PvdO family nonheme iron enzyme [Flavobacteriales bacterium]HMR28142.1 SUMF1/EgtB/PvdO family nonheme iron enzyme [Flavobacteriales bacterium]